MIIHEFRKVPDVELVVSRSKRSHPDVVSSMASPGAALRTSHDPLFETAKTDKTDHILELALEVTLNNEIQTGSSQVAVATDGKLNVKHEL